ncbi:MAG: hypothetical protein LBR49_00825 [Tannerella sp.]|nr:hypothetical protein [Tannerella sp.]
MKHLNKKIHCFNPGHETAVLSGKTAYTPPAIVRRMASELSLLPLWYGEEGDFVFTDEPVAAIRFLSSLPDIIRPKVIPLSENTIDQLRHQENPPEIATWGLAPNILQGFEKLRQRSHDLFSVPTWNDACTRLTGRQTAASCLYALQSLLPDSSLPLPPHFCEGQDEIRRFMAGCPPPYVLKMPYSCSGRGVFWLNNRHLDKRAICWINGVLKKQGVVSIEQALDKVCDFAMEFVSDGQGTVDFEGWSVFDTHPDGSFNGNWLGSQALLEKHLLSYVPSNQMNHIRESVTKVLSDTLSNDYKGFMGVDMMIYRQNGIFAIHPMVEINLRYTMGLVAMQLSRLVHHASQGRFIVACRPTGEGYASHLEMQKTHPLRLDEGKIRSGYLALCPVKPETQYRAFLIVTDGINSAVGY